MSLNGPRPSAGEVLSHAGHLSSTLPSGSYTPVGGPPWSLPPLHPAVHTCAPGTSTSRVSPEATEHPPRVPVVPSCPRWLPTPCPSWRRSTRSLCSGPRSRRADPVAACGRLCLFRQQGLEDTRLPRPCRPICLRRCPGFQMGSVLGGGHTWGRGPEGGPTVWGGTQEVWVPPGLTPRGSPDAWSRRGFLPPPGRSLGPWPGPGISTGPASCGARAESQTAR